MFNIHIGMVIYLKFRHKIGLNPNHYDPLFGYVTWVCLFMTTSRKLYRERCTIYNNVYRVFLVSPPSTPHPRHFINEKAEVQRP